MPKRNSKTMTVAGINRLKLAAPGQRDEYFDRKQDGLALRVSDRGTKSWSVYYRFAGRHQRMTLGRYDEKKFGPDKARAEAERIKAFAKDGIDPKQILEAERQARQREAAALIDGHQTFGPLAEKYIKRECGRLKRGEARAKVIRRRLIPAWGNKAVADIDIADAVALTDALLDEGKPAAAFEIYEICKRIFNWAVSRQESEVKGLRISPLAGMKPPTKKKPRQRKLFDPEVQALWRACDTLGYPSGPLLRLLLATGQRRGEVADMRWSEINLDAREWIIPKERAKNGIAHLVPLSGMAVDILEPLPRFNAGDCVFSTTSGRRPVSGFSKFKTRASDFSGVEKWSLHDIRRTVRSGLSACRVPQEHSERVLNHLPQGVLKTYDVHEYADEKRDALDLWAARLRDIVEPAPENVVAMTAREVV